MAAVDGAWKEAEPDEGWFCLLMIEQEGFLDSLIFHGQYPEGVIRPGVANQIRGIISAGVDIHLNGGKGLVGRAMDGGNADDDDGHLPDDGEAGAVGNVELIGACHSLLIWGHLLEANVSEYGFSAIKHQIVGGTVAGHVGHAVTSGAVRNVRASHVRNPNHVQVAGARVRQYHGDLFTRYKGEGLLQQNGSEADGPSHRNGMESIGNPVIITYCAKTGVDGVVNLVDGNGDRKGIGRCI